MPNDPNTCRPGGAHAEQVRLGLAAGVLSVGLLLAACSPEPEASSGPPPTPTVSVAAPIVRTIVEYDDYTGRFQSVDEVQVQARVSGYLEEVRFTPGEIVEKDAVLFVIDQRPFQAASDAAEADVTAAEAQLKLAEAELKRAEPLLKRGNLSESAFDERVQQRNVAVATLKRAQANLRQADLNLEFTEVRAPVSGRISRDLVNVGNLVTGGTTGASPLTSIVALDPIHFYFTASEQNYLKYVRLNQQGDRQSARQGQTPAWVRLSDEAEFTRAGHIDFVDNRLSESTGTITARAIFDNSDYFLTPGLFGRIRLPGSGEYDAVLIPDTAIGSDQTEKFVYVVGEENTAERRRVVTGNRYGGLRIIRDGLTAEDRVIVSGIQRVRPNAPIAPEDTEITLEESAFTRPVPAVIPAAATAPAPDIQSGDEATETDTPGQDDAPAQETQSDSGEETRP